MTRRTWRARTGIRVALVALLVGALAPLVGMVGSQATPSTDATVTGTVTQLGGTAIEGASITAFRALDFTPVASTTSASDGQYSLPVAPGDYVLRFTAVNHSTRYNASSVDLASAPPLALTSGAAVTENSVLPQTDARVHGVVAAQGNGFLPGATARVISFADNEVAATAITDANGAWSANVPVGRYIVRASANGYAARFRPESAPDERSAAIINVFPGGDIDAGFIALPRAAGSIRGTVTVAGASSSLTGATVDVVDPRDNRVVTTTTTDFMGNYDIPVSAGDYILRLSKTGFVTRWVSPAAPGDPNASESNATLASVQPEMPTPPMPSTALVAMNARLSGNVTHFGQGVSGATVRVLDMIDNHVAATVQTTTQAGENWSVEVPPGQYAVRIEATGFVSQWVGGQWNTPETQVGRTVVAGQQLSLGPTDIRRPTAELRGNLYEGTANDALTTVAHVTAFDLQGNPIASTDSTSNGSYALALPRAGQYIIGFDDNPRVPQWYRTGVASNTDEFPNRATVLNVGPEEVVFLNAVHWPTTAPTSASGTGVLNGTLTRQTAINGGLAPAAGMDVDVLDAGTLSSVAHLVTAGDGTFSVTLPSARYIVRYRDGAQTLRTTLLTGVASLPETFPVFVGAANTATFNDTMLLVVGELRGLVGQQDQTINAYNAPIPGARVDVFDLVSGAKVATTTTDAGSAYAVTLPPGQYVVHATGDPAPVGFLGAWAGGTGQVLSGGGHAVNSGQSTPLPIFGIVRNLGRITVQVDAMSGVDPISVQSYLQSAEVVLYRADTGAEVSRRALNGRTSVDIDVPPATYLGRVTGDNAPLGWLGGWANSSSSSPLRTASNASTLRLDPNSRLTMAAGAQRQLARIAGRVDADDPLHNNLGAMGNVTVKAFDMATGALAATAVSDISGSYRFDVAPGAYAVRTTSIGNVWLGQWPTGAPDIQGVTPLVLRPGDQTQVNLRERRNVARVAGRTSLVGGSSLAGIAVSAYSVSTGEQVGTMVSDSNGTFSFDVAPGPVLVVGVDPNGALAPKWRTSAASVTSADMVMTQIGVMAGSQDLNFDRPPVTVDAGPAQTAAEGGALTVSASFVDSVSGANHSATIDWGDGSSSPATIDEANHTASATHTYADDLAGTITVRVISSATTGGSDTTPIVVTNVAPTAPGTPTLSGRNPSNTGTHSLSWTPATDVAGDTVTYAVEHRDADDSAWSTVAAGLTDTSYSFSANPAETEGTWAYRVVASDEDGGASTSDALAGVVVDTSAPNAPAIAADRAADYTAADGAEWFKDTVTLHAQANGDPSLVDGSEGSGVDAASISAPVTFDTDGSHALIATVDDLAKNRSQTASRTVIVDAKAPTIDLRCGNTSPKVGDTAGATWTAGDGVGSGLRSAASGNLAYDTSTPGTRTATTPDAVDNVGHVTPGATCTYTVVDPTPPGPRYTWRGFFSPVDNDNLNAVKAGSTVPFKFSLGGNFGMAIFADGYPASRVCGTTGPLSAMVNPGGSSLSYDATTDQYQFNWKTDKATRAGTCLEAVFKLADGSEHTARFSFK